MHGNRCGSLSPHPPGTVPSYIQHVIHPVAKNGEDERELLLRFGRVLAEISLAAGDGPAKARQEFVRSRVEEAFPN